MKPFLPPRTLPFVVAALVACISGSACARVAPGGDEASSQILIEEYGDSTTVGYSMTPAGSVIVAGNQPNTLQSLLRTEFGDRVVVKNEGVGGIQSSDALHGTDGIHANWESVMKTSHAQIVTLNFGLNDAFFHARPAAGKYSVSPQDYRKVMGELVDIAQRHGKTVVLYEPNPSCHPARKDVLEYYVMQLDQMSVEKNVPLVSQYWGFISDPDWNQLLSDCTHPTSSTYQTKGKNAYRIVEPIVRGLIGGR